MGRHINFESGNYYEQAALKRKKGKGKKEITVVRGNMWFVGNGPPNETPQSEWSPSVNKFTPQPGDFYLNTRTGAYSELLSVNK